jgi:putative DNA primase/helicase
MDAQSISKALPGSRAVQGGFVARCPAHEDKSPSLSISDGEGGKILVHCHAGCSQQDVVNALKSRGLWPEKIKMSREEKRIVATYDYVDAEGVLQMQVVRFEPKDFRQRRPVAGGGWSWSVPKEFRTLFNLPAVLASSKAVCIVEGEKDVLALAAIGVVATCNPGGAGKWDDRYTALLKDRDVAILPDNDEPGENHAQLVSRSLRGSAKTIRIIRLPGLPPKGDVSDWIGNGGTRDALLRIFRDSPVLPDHAPASDDRGGRSVDSDVDTPFRALGFNNGQYFYLSVETQQVTALSGPQHTKMNLFTIAPMQFWEREFPSKNGADYDVAADSMMRLCANRGIFSPEIMRGRGAWYDAGRIVLHMGDRLYVDRQPMSPLAIRSSYVYERGIPLTADIDNPVSTDDSYRLVQLMRMLPWASEIDALYVAGWCVLAHIGGVLNWRPHIWVVGSKGTGKSHVMSQIIRPLLGDNCLFVVSETTEAGVRQSLRHDSLPVLFDEAEGEDQRSQDRMQRILALVRQSSSETGGKIAKGTVSGNAMSFNIRSCFAFSSINASLVQQSDRSRVTVVELKPEKRKHTFDEILAAEADLLTDQFISGFYARSINLASTIRHNALVFSKAAAAIMGEQRAGDQIGALLAGAFSLESDQKITFEIASMWLSEFDWAETKDEVQGMSDEKSLLDFLLQQVVRLEDEQSSNRTIGELVDMVRMQSHYAAGKTLGRLGFKVEDGGLLVSNTADGVRRLLQKTQWSVNWSKILRRLPGARAAGVTYFGFVGSDTRAVWVPL